MSKLMELRKVRHGKIFSLDGVGFIKLADKQGVVFALAVKAVLKNVPFEKGNVIRKDYNNYSGSNLEHVMECWVQNKHPGIYNALQMGPIDLTTVDGMPDYGCPFVIIRALTLAEYKKYLKFIPPVDVSYWLSTGMETKNSRYPITNVACYVRTNCALRDGNVFHSDSAARPALYLHSSLLVSVEDGEEEEKNELADYTDTELIEELYSRRKMESEY